MTAFMTAQLGIGNKFKTIVIPAAISLKQIKKMVIIYPEDCRRMSILLPDPDLLPASRLVFYPQHVH